MPGEEFAFKDGGSACCKGDRKGEEEGGRGAPMGYFGFLFMS